MFRRLSIIGSLAVAASFAAVPAAAQSIQQRLAKDVVVAVVEGENVMSSDLIAAFRTLPRKVQQRGLRAIYPTLLERMIDAKLMTIHGRLNKLADDPEVKKRLEKAEDQIVRDVYVSRLVQQSLTEEKMRARYYELVQNTPTQDEVRARHILLKTEGEAREVIRLINGGNDFAEVAKQRSTGPSAAQGGDLGFFRRSDMLKPFADAAFALKPGEVTPNPIKTEFGWHVIKVEEHNAGVAPPYERMRNQIAQDISQRVTAAAVKQARAAAKIKRFTLDGQPVPAPSAAPAQPAAPKKK